MCIFWVISVFLLIQTFWGGIKLPSGYATYKDSIKTNQKLWNILILYRYLFDACYYIFLKYKTCF